MSDIAEEADQDLDNEKDESQAQDDEELLRLARERFDLAVEAESQLREDALDDLRFSAGEQWPDDVKRAREQDRRPCLTINRLPSTIHQITNDQRQNRPSIKVSPVDDDADVETAKVFQGLIRHIENQSDADTAYDTAFDSAVRGGFGYFRITTQYVSPMSFNQEIRIKRIRNRFSVYLDPNYQEPDGSDANWGFVFENLSKEEYKSQYQDSQMASMEDWSSIGDSMPGWASETSVRVAEYFYKVWEDAEILLLSNGEVIDAKGLPDGQQLPNGIKIVNRKKTKLPKIKWCKHNAVEVLDRTDWLGQYIPIVPVLGDELDIDGKRTLQSVVRHAKDPQRMYNYWASAETEAIALAPRAPFIAAEGQIEGFEEQWLTANTRNHAVLQYKQVSANGTPAPPPQRQMYDVSTAAITNARGLSAQDIKDTTGVYDATLGNRSNEQSGLAIQRRNAQAQTSNFHFSDNLSKSIRHAGRILVDLIPKIYDTPQAIRILHPDSTEEVVLINQEFQQRGEVVSYNLGVGKYDVTVSTGPSYETKRQEAAASMSDLVRAYPNMMPVVGDLLVKNLDWPGADEISARLKKMVPPQFIDDKNQPPIPPQVQAQIAQMNQMIDQLTQHLNEKTQIIETKALDIESRERIETMKQQTQLQIELAKMGSKEAIVSFQEELAHLRHRMELLHSSIPIQQEISGAGAQGAAMPEQAQQAPTGGQNQSPGQPMGV